MPGTEGLSLQSLVSSVDYSYSASLAHPFKFSVQKHRGRYGIQRRSVTCSKTSGYQDFQGYARPLRLFPITEPSSSVRPSLEELSTSLRVDSESVYMVTIYTSTMFSSDLSDPNTGILLCLIDENGDSILQRLPATPVGVPIEANVPDLRFQRGSVDEIIFKGPKLGRIQALWIGLESGCWRLGGVTLTIVTGTQNYGSNYKFEAEDIQIGDADMSMVELKPIHITNLSETDMSNISATTKSHSISNEESMKEYTNLKSSLLLYDSLLIFTGTSIAAIFNGEEAALAFLIGGALGFLYLLFLQKSVDELPTGSSVSKARSIGPVVLAVAFSVVVSYSFEGVTVPIALTAQDILVGMVGFLVCKVAVLLAAFKPMQIMLEEDE